MSRRDNCSAAFKATAARHDNFHGKNLLCDKNFRHNNKKNPVPQIFGAGKIFLAEIIFNAVKNALRGF